uniref:snRNA-activating protein complex subunit 3 n=1 Tax=Rhodosorus marinus TaxID=101924 RepID=A0A7S0BQQ6_9RHOD|mmetsp:Transcript_423/g.545  ORF Transcript_423/g.545 Transcript_423/m.545 type:complete len:355 (+) Transcript_423:157-1221(+)
MVEEQLRKGFSDLVSVGEFGAELQEFFQFVSSAKEEDPSRLLDGVDVNGLRQIRPQLPVRRRGRRSHVDKARAHDEDRQGTLVDTDCALKSYRLKVLTKKPFSSFDLPAENCPKAKIAPSRAHAGGADEEVAVVHVAIYDSTRANKSQEFLVLSNQKLDELSTKISCRIDEASETHSNGGFFFIEGVFYGSGGPGDSSATVKQFLDRNKQQWRRTPEKARSAASSRRRIKSEFREAAVNAAPSLNYSNLSIEETSSASFDQLKIRLGFPYIYVHRHSCEHLIVFRDLRSRSFGVEASGPESFPMTVYQLPGRTRKCTVCISRHATKRVLHDPLAEESPAFFCEGEIRRCIRKRF